MPITFLDQYGQIIEPDEGAELERDLAMEAAVRSDPVVSLTDGFNPQGSFVYILWGTSRSRPLYVGSSTNVLARLGAHMVNPERRPSVRHVAIYRCKNPQQMRAHEGWLIRALRPTWNISW